MNNFFFSSRRRHTRFDCDWSSDVCSSDLELDAAGESGGGAGDGHGPRELRAHVHARPLGGAGVEAGGAQAQRSEERRVGKEGRSWWTTDHSKKNTEYKKIEVVYRNES